MSPGALKIRPVARSATGDHGLPSEPPPRQVSEAFEVEPVLPSIFTELEKLDIDVLRKRWRSVLRKPVPASLSRSLMLRILAWREQVNQTGDLDRASLRILEEAASGDLKLPRSKIGALGMRQLRPGMVLVREHGGSLHRVSVLSDGFAWNGQTFTSLSAVAKAITGINWNGPRFFGLARSSRARAAAAFGSGPGRSAAVVNNPVDVASQEPACGRDR